MARRLNLEQSIALDLALERAPSESWRASDPSRLLELIEHHRLWAHAQRVVDHLPRQVGTRVTEVSTRQRLSTLVTSSALVRVDAALREAGIAPLLIKGPVLAALYSSAELRPFEDLDLLVRPVEFATALEALEASGLQVVDRNWELIRRLQAGELALAARGKGTVDLHWHLLYTRERRDEFWLPTDELVDRARIVEIRGHEYRTLSIPDALVHLSLHAAREGADRLIWLKDVDRMIRTAAVDWDAVAEAARRSRAALAVALVVARVREVFDTPVPAGFCGSLASRSWVRLVSTIDALFPAVVSSGFGNPATLLARSASTSVRSSLGVAAKGGLLRARRVVGQGAAGRDEAQLDPRDPGSLRFPTGNEETRARYLADVAEFGEAERQRRARQSG